MSRHERGKRNYVHGQWAETLAVWALRCKGYRVIARRVAGKRGTGAGEIDIVAKRGKTLVFVEVKRRRNQDDGLAALTHNQQRRISRGAEHFLKTYDGRHPLTCRFDVIIVVPWRWPIHIKNAFSAV